MMSPTRTVVALLFAVAAGCGEAPEKVTNNGASLEDQNNTEHPYDGPSARGASTFGFALVAQESTFSASSYEPEYDEDACNASCDQNTALELDAPLFVVNGQIEPEPTANLTDDFAIFVAFRDAECNLACGMRSDSQNEPQGSSDGAQSLPTNVPCSTDESNVYFRLTPGSYPLDPGQYEYRLWLEDSCGGRSNVQTIAFELN